MIQTTTRNATLDDVHALLTTQQTRKLDVVAPATALRSEEGVLRIRGTEPVLTDDGVTTADGLYVPTAVCDEQLAGKLGVPVGYLRRLREERPDLYDANVNGWLHGRRPKVRTVIKDAVEGTVGQEVVREGTPADPRSFLVRTFRGDGHVGAGAALIGGTPTTPAPGIARAFLSDRYAMVDNLDVLLSALEGIREAGVEVNIDGADLTERRMVVRVSCPAVSALAPDLLAGYRSPFTGASGSENPTVWAGFLLSNSEVGGGAYTIAPRITVEVCKNGMTMSKDALSKVHLGGRLDAGTVRWGADTADTAVELVKKQTRDAVRTFLSPEYLTATVTRLEARAGEPLNTHEEVRTLTKGLRYTEAETEGILAHFTRGGQMTRGGVVNAITAYAQTVEDGDQAYELEGRVTSLLV